MNDEVNITITQHVQCEIQEMLMRSAVKDCYNDVMVVCKDNTVWESRVILALAYPLMAEILRDRNEDKELVLILPDFTAEEVNTRVAQFLSGNIKEETIVKEEAIVIHDKEETTFGQSNVALLSFTASEEQEGEDCKSDIDAEITRWFEDPGDVEKTELSLNTTMTGPRHDIVGIPIMKEKGNYHSLHFEYL